MSSKSKFGALGAAFKERKGAAASPAKAERVVKSRDKETYAQTTVYLHRQEVYAPLQAALAKEKLEYSQLVEDLLREWLKGRKS